MRNNALKYKVYQMSRFIIYLSLIVSGVLSYGSDPEYVVISATTKSGTPYIFIRNYTKRTLTCVVHLNNGGMFDIHVKPRSDSTRKKEPEAGYTINCR